MAAKASPKTTSALPACSVRVRTNETSRRARIPGSALSRVAAGPALSRVGAGPALSRAPVERHADGEELPFDVRDELRVARAEARIVRLEVVEVRGDERALGARAVAGGGLAERLLQLAAALRDTGGRVARLGERPRPQGAQRLLLIARREPGPRELREQRLIGTSRQLVVVGR